jgi:uncharacterized protein YbjT (DUF2867 family)
MKVVVIGGTGRIGAKVVGMLNELGHDAIAAAPETGVNTLTNEGVDEAVTAADVIVDVSNAPSFEDQAVMDFFTVSTRNVLAAANAAGVAHCVVLSVVGSDRLPDSGYLRAKVNQEKLIADSGIPFTIVRATQFYEFLRGIADASTVGGQVRLPPVQFQPMAASDVVAGVVEASVGTPANGIQELGGPERVRMDELIARVLLDGGDWREVVSDQHATYFGTELADDSLVPGPEASLSTTTYADWARLPLSPSGAA